MQPFRIYEPTAAQVPIVISVPHCGTDFPDELRDEYESSLISVPDDTDWFVDRLYDFAPSLGMTMITAVYSRWVIDLNRAPDSKPLYSDGRIITGLCPTTTFLGQDLYRDRRKDVSREEIERRLDKYYWPYHQKLSALLTDMRSRFGTVLLWDCHSIRQIVPTIQADRFPDLILGSADETSAGTDLINSTLKVLGLSHYTLFHNTPFKGGFITRNYGRPDEGQHALQLEMTKVNYMNDAETLYDPQRASRMQELLKTVFQSLVKELK